MYRIASVCFLATLFTSSSAKADLVIDILGTPGSGLTTWTFSGSATATTGGQFESGTNLAENDGWQNFANTFNNGLNSSDPLDIPITGPTISIAGTNFAMDRIQIDNDESGLDDLAFGIANGSNVFFVADDVISWSGSFDLGQDINGMNIGTFSDSTPSFGGLALQVNISAVPEPSSLATLLLAWPFFWRGQRRQRVGLLSRN